MSCRSKRQASGEEHVRDFYGNSSDVIAWAATIRAEPDFQAEMTE